MGKPRSHLLDIYGTQLHVATTKREWRQLAVEGNHMTAIVITCTCGSALAPHCFVANDCGWLKCRNARCPWDLWDVTRGVGLDRDGRVLPMPKVE